MKHALISFGPVCLLLQAFFAGAEIALIGCDRVRVQKEASQGLRASRLLDTLLSAGHRF